MTEMYPPDSVVTMEKRTGENRMSVGFALFNLHVNDAGRKAKQIYIDNFGEASWNEHLEKYADGIMALMSDPWNFYTGFFAATVTLIVNGDLHA